MCSASNIKSIGVLTGGGDAPGLNAVIRAVVKTAVSRYGWSVMGIEDGFEGLIGGPRVRQLVPEDVRGLLPRGGTILGTSNRGHFVVRQVGDQSGKNEGSYLEALANLKKLGLDALVVIGGEGSQSIANVFCEMGFPVIGVPKTIDNDLAGTDATFGFDTALEISTEAIDRLHTTAESHDRVMVVEVMGRHAGWIALHSGIGGGADIILIPEIPFHISKVVDKVKEREQRGRHFSIVVTSEGATPAGGGAVYQDGGGADHAPRLGGIAEQVAGGITKLTEKETRTVVLGYLQRGGTPTASDRVLATAYGSAAVRALADGKAGHLVSWSSKGLGTTPISECVSRLNDVPRDHYLIAAARDVGISFAGDED